MDKITIGNGTVSPFSVASKGQIASGPAGAFSEVLSKAVDEVTNLHQNADKAIMNIQGGRTDSLHEAIIALEKADVSFRTMLTIRNKLIESYQEIMRMQV
jgi:flagellar hook-basal body complex protein FliE